MDTEQQINRKLKATEMLFYRETLRISWVVLVVKAVATRISKNTYTQNGKETAENS